MGADVKVTSAFDGAAVRTGLAEMRGEFRKQTEEIGRDIKRTLTVGAIFEGAKGIIEYGTQLDTLSQKFGVSAEALQKFGYAAKQNGSSLESVASAFNKMEIARSKALAGNSAMISAFEGLNVSLDDLQKLSPEEIMTKIGSSSLNAADLVKVLGKSALQLRPALDAVAEGEANIGVLSNEAVHRLRELDDEFTAIKQTITVGLGNVFTGFVAAWQTGWYGIATIASIGAKAVVTNITAVGKALKGDLTGAKQDLDNYFSFQKEMLKSVDEYGDEKFGRNVDKSQPIHKRFDAEPGSDGGLDENTANLQRALGGHGGGSGSGDSTESLRERLAKLQEAHDQKQLTSHERLMQLLQERDSLLTHSAETNVTEEGTLKTNIALAENQVELDKANAENTRDIAAHQKKITEERTKEAGEMDKISASLKQHGDHWLEEAEQRERAGAAEEAQTAILQLELSGQTELAALAHTKAGLEREIADARARGYTKVADELEKQKQIVIQEAKKTAELKEQERIQGLINTAKDEENNPIAARRARLALRDLDLTGRNGTGIAAGSPNYTDVALGLATDPITGRINQRELDRQRAFAELRLLRGESTPALEQYQANRNLTQLSQNQTAQALEQQRLDNANRQLEIIRQLQELNGYVRPSPGDG